MIKTHEINDWKTDRDVMSFYQLFCHEGVYTNKTVVFLIFKTEQRINVTLNTNEWIFVKIKQGMLMCNDSY